MGELRIFVVWASSWHSKFLVYVFHLISSGVGLLLTLHTNSIRVDRVKAKIAKSTGFCSCTETMMNAVNEGGQRRTHWRHSWILATVTQMLLNVFATNVLSIATKAASQFHWNSQIFHRQALWQANIQLSFDEKVQKIEKIEKKIKKLPNFGCFPFCLFRIHQFFK